MFVKEANEKVGKNEYHENVRGYKNELSLAMVFRIDEYSRNPIEM